MSRTIVFLSFVLWSFYALSLPAQPLTWTNVSTFNGRIGTVYFLDEDTGFVSVAAVPGGSTSPKLLKTTDGGQIWNAAILEDFTGDQGIQDIIMLDRLHGYACGGAGTTSVWQTQDGGLTWQSIVKESKFAVSIRKTAAGILLTNFYGADIEAAFDGATFNSIFSNPSPDSFLGMDFTDALHGVAVGSYRTKAPWYYTEDGGKTWNPTSVNMESWSIYGQPNSNNFFAVPEEWTSTTDPEPSSCYRSTDLGKTWNTISHFKQRMNGTVIGIKDILYTQTYQAYSQTGGLFRSLDSGITWVPIGGPNNFNDTRFSIIPKNCSTAVLYVGGDDHILYKAYEDLSISKEPGLKLLSTSTGMINLGLLSYCKEIDTALTLSNTGCSPLHIFSISGSGTGFTVQDTSCILAPGASIQVAIHSHADTTGGQKRNFGSISVFSDADVAVPPFSFYRTIVYPHAYSTSVSSLIFDTISYCSERDTSFWIKSIGCDTLHIYHISSTAGIRVPDTSLALPPGDSINITVRTLADTTNGQTVNSGSITISADEGVIQTPISFSRIILYPHVGFISTDPIVFASSSYCTPEDSVLIIRSTGCDTLHITHIVSDAGVIISDTMLAIAPGDSARIPLHVIADTTGHTAINQGVITITSDATPSLSTPSFFHPIAYPQPYTISSSSINFGSPGPCSETDTTIRIRSIGCDTLHIQHITVGAGFWVDDTTLTLIPGDFADIVIHTKRDTSSHPTTNAAFVSFTSNPPISGINLRRTVTYSQGPLLSKQVFDFGTSSLCTDKDTTLFISNFGCDTLHITGIKASGGGFSVHDTAFAIAPGESNWISIYSSPDTTGHPNSNMGTVTISADAPIPPVLLTRGILYPTEYTIHLVLGVPSGKNQTEVPVYIIADSLPSDVTRIEARVHIGDTNLLSLIDIRSLNSVSIEGDSVVIIGLPVINANDTLVTFIYRTFFTDNITTSISLSDISYYHAATTLPCDAIVTGSSVLTYDFIYSCGEPTLLQLLHGDPIIISSITPNPTQHEIEMIINSPITSGAYLNIYDLLGHRASTVPAQLAKGKNILRLPVIALSPGTYSVVIQAGNLKTSGIFIKE